MENDFNYFDNAPSYFSMCLKSECASADKCLRALVARDMNQSRQNLLFINPYLVNTAGEGDCPYFKPVETERVAYGFKSALGLVPTKNTKTVRDAIAALFGRREFYKLLRAERPINLEKQEQIATIMANNGVPSPIEFDSYQETAKWE